MLAVVYLDSKQEDADRNRDQRPLGDPASSAQGAVRRPGSVFSLSFLIDPFLIPSRRNEKHRT
jgi:hypothetical protein